MWRTLVLVTACGVFMAPAFATPAAAGDAKRTQAQLDQQASIQALSQRGKLSAYQQVLATAKGWKITPTTDATGKRVQLSAEQTDAVMREAAIDLTSLGLTAADVTAYRKRGVDLYDVVTRFFSGSTTAAEQMLMADTVVIATAGELDNRARLDGYLSAWPYTVVKTLKGSRATGDTIYIPRKSGKTSDGMMLDVSSEPSVTPGTQYLLVLSKNLYEQRTVQKNKQIEVGFSGLPYLMYEVSKDGSLKPGPQPVRSKNNPKDIKSIIADLEKTAL